MTQKSVSDRDIYFFDLHGYLVIDKALSHQETVELNAVIDQIPHLKPGQQWKGVYAHWYNDNDGLNLQQIYEAGDPFERLIDHPAWYEHMKKFVGGEGTFDWHHGPLFIDENFVNIRGPGESIGMHSGGHLGAMRNQYQVINREFHCGQVNLLIALTDIGPGDGGTLVIPGSHKSNFAHPDANDFEMYCKHAGEIPEGAIEIHMKTGDALLFVDTICHGGAKRTNDGQRRTVVYRYGPSWGRLRHNYEVSQGLLSRLTPRRRDTIQPRSMNANDQNDLDRFTSSGNKNT